MRRYVIGTLDGYYTLLELALVLERRGITDEEFDNLASIPVGTVWTVEDRSFVVRRIADLVKKG